MTILSDLYRKPPNQGLKRKAAQKSYRTRHTQQSRLDHRTLLTRPDSETARKEIEAHPFEVPFIADWVDAVFLHYEVDPEALAEAIPFPLDTHEGKAYLSLVAFTMRAMRPKWGGKATRWLTAPIATHQFLNLRTYVKHRGHYGIYFMKEWLNRPLAVKLGPLTFGLPYHSAEICYEHCGNEVCGTVAAENQALQYRGKRAGTPAPAETGTRDAFLLERYTAFTDAGRHPKFFRISHEPWEVQPLAALEVVSDDLIKNEAHPWSDSARLIGGHFSPGVEGVLMGRPHPVL